MMTAKKPTDLDVASPENVPMVLRVAADMFRESAVELAAAWQDQNAGKVWDRIANILDAAAYKIEKKLS
jgi:hypothetical protein